MTAKRQSLELAEYRRHCVDAGQKAQEDFDKSVLSLSGGALGVSFAFLKDVIGPGPVRGSVWLVAAWTVWALSIVAVLSSFFFSQLALRTAITQVDDATIHTQHPGRWYTRATMGLNIAAGLLFLAGVIAMVVFVRENFLVPNVAP